MSNVIKLPLYLNVIDEIIDTYSYGDLIPLIWLQERLEIIYKEKMTRAEFQALQFQWLTQMDGLKTVLLERYCMLFKNIRGEGYQIVLPNDQSDEAMVELKKNVGREMRKCQAILANVNMNLLSDSGHQRLVLAHNNLAAIEAFSRQSLRKYMT